MALPTPSTPIAKSLHTLTVLQQVAKLIYRVDNQMAEGVTWAGSLDAAMVELGLYGRPDPYGLRDRALFLLEKGA